MEEKYFVEIKDDFGKVRVFEVPTLEMKIAIDNIDKELKEKYKRDAMRYAITFSHLGDNVDDWLCDHQDKTDYSEIFKLRRKVLYKALWNVVKKMQNEKYKKIIYMRFKQGLKFNKIAEYLGCKKQTISDNYKTAIEDLRVMLANDKKFKETSYYRHFERYAQVETNLTAKQEINSLSDSLKFINTDNIRELIDDIKSVDKRQRKLGITDKKNSPLKQQKVKVFGNEYSIEDMINIVSETLDKISPKTKKIQ